MLHKFIIVACLSVMAAVMVRAQEVPDTIRQEAIEPAVKIEVAEPVEAPVEVIVLDEVVVEEAALEEDGDLPDWDSLISVLNIENDSDFTGFSMLDSVLLNYRVFFVGENHQFRHSNQKLHLKMLKYLYYNAGVRNLILEFGVSSGLLINDYVQTGDSSLYAIFEIYAYKSWANFIKELAVWNLSLDSAERIRVVGIDVERFQNIPLKVLSLYLPKDKPTPDEITLSVESLLSMVTYLDNQARKEDNESESYYWSMPTYDIDNHVDELLKEYEAHKDAYRSYIGEQKFHLFDTVMVSLRDHKTYADYIDKRLPQGPIYRERYMLSQFYKLLAENPEGRFFGQFGRCHVGTKNQEEACNWHNFNSIAQRINHGRDTLAYGKVCSIATFYPKSDSFSDEVSEISELRTIARQTIGDTISLLGMKGGDPRFGKLPEMYHFIIINNNKLEDEEAAEEADTVAEEYVEEEESRGPHLIAGFSYQARLFNLSDLNTTLEYSGYYSQFNPISMNSSAYAGLYWPGFFTSLGVQFGSRQAIKTNDGLYDRQSLNHWGAMYSLGFGNLQNPLHFTSQITLRYDVLQFDMLQLNALGAPRFGSFGEPLYSSFMQEAFVIGGQAGLGFSIREVVEVGGFAGYNLDVSKPVWTQQGTEVMNVPESKLNGLYFGANLSILIPLRSKKAEVPEEEVDY